MDNLAQTEVCYYTFNYMFKDRGEAGRKLAEKLMNDGDYGGSGGIVLAIPRGGIVVGKEISRKINLPLDVLVTKKLPAPENPELAIGAIGEGETIFYNKDVCQSLCITEAYKKQVIEEKRKELSLKNEFFRKGKPPLDLKDKRVILTDDGVATGATIIAAIKVAKAYHPKEIIVAIPVVALDTLSQLQKEADQVIYLEAPEMFLAVGQFYQNFNQISDQEVIEILSN